LADGVVPFDAEYVESELVRREVPAAWAGEQVEHDVGWCVGLWLRAGLLVGLCWECEAELVGVHVHSFGSMEVSSGHREVAVAADPLPHDPKPPGPSLASPPTEERRCTVPIP
jgi:hypothetical protein